MEHKEVAFGCRDLSQRFQVHNNKFNLKFVALTNFLDIMVDLKSNLYEVI